MAVNLLTRRLAGISLSLSGVSHTTASSAARRIPQMNCTQNSPALASPAPVPAVRIHLLPTAGYFSGRRWMSIEPAPSLAPQDDKFYNGEDEALVSEDGGAATFPTRTGGEYGFGTHKNGMPRFPKYRKIPPHIVRRRIKKLRTYLGTEKGIRYSPWRMNLICRFAAGQTVPEVQNQLQFVRKRKAPLLKKVIKRTTNLADIRDGLQPSQLEVAECFATHGQHLKRLNIMGRGRSGVKHRRHCHIRLVLREIDFPLKVAQATTEHQKRRWLEKMRLADLDAADAKKERDELERLEREAAERDKAKAAAEEKK